LRCRIWYFLTHRAIQTQYAIWNSEMVGSEKEFSIRSRQWNIAL
jgi:hypothetical protein